MCVGNEILKLIYAESLQVNAALITLAVMKLSQILLK